MKLKATGVAAIGLVLLMSAWPSLAMASSPDPAETHRAVQQVLAAAAYQSELPRGSAVEEGSSSDTEDATGGDSDTESVMAWLSRILSGPIGAIARVILWIAVITGIALAVFFLVTEFVHRPLRTSPKNPRAGKPAPTDSDEAPAPAATVSLAEADQLARQGKFAEAIHLLLLGGIENLRRMLERTVARSLTSREILGRFALPETERSGLAALVSASEISHFGGRPVTEADYSACRDSFLRIVANPARTP